jgi:hypothetical protein
MVGDRQAFAAALSGILGVDCFSCFEASHGKRMNPRSSQRELAFNSFRSRHPLAEKTLRRLPGARLAFKHMRNFAKQGEAIKIELSAEQRTLIEEIYGESNRRLAARHDLPLEAYGYPLVTGAAAPAQSGASQ